VRRLSARQAVTCETAKGRRCRCRCGGLLHGAGRFTDADGARLLPDDDPHAPPLIQPALFTRDEVMTHG